RQERVGAWRIPFMDSWQTASVCLDAARGMLQRKAGGRFFSGRAVWRGALVAARVFCRCLEWRRQRKQRRRQGSRLENAPGKAGGELTWFGAVRWSSAERI